MAETSLSDLRNYALRLLARRDYSRLELRQRLERKTTRTSLIESLLDELREAGYQSDQRFTESFIHARVAGHYGPERIRLELRQRGIEQDSIDTCLEQIDADWQLMACQLATRKHRSLSSMASTPASQPDQKQRYKNAQKVLRYLVSRGFTPEMARKALSSVQNQEGTTALEDCD